MKLTTEVIKQIVGVVKQSVQESRISKHSRILGAVAKKLGYKNWEALAAHLDSLEKRPEFDQPKSEEDSGLGLLYSFSELKPGKKFTAFNGKNLLAITGRLDLVPGHAALSHFELNQEGNLSAVGADQTDMYWDDQYPSEGPRPYIDESDQYVSIGDVVFVRGFEVTRGDLEAMAPRGALLKAYWTEIDNRMDAVKFLAWPAEKKTQFIETVVAPAIGFALTTTELQTMLDNQVFGESFLNTWFKISSPPGLVAPSLGADFGLIRAMNKTDPSRVWTVIESDGLWSTTSGFHTVNVQGYYLTEKELPASIVALEFFDEDFHEDEDYSEDNDDEFEEYHTGHEHLDSLSNSRNPADKK